MKKWGVKKALLDPAVEKVGGSIDPLDPVLPQSMDHLREKGPIFRMTRGNIII